MINSPVSVLILSAGNSGRMGREKAHLPYGNGLTFSGQLIKTYTESGYRPVMMVVNERFIHKDPFPDGVECILNRHPEWGRAHSLMLGIRHIPPGSSCFLQNIDNPFITSALLAQMCEAILPQGYVLPVQEGKGGHPILLGTQVVQHLSGKEKIQDLRDELKIFQRIEVPFPDERIHLNINTPEDYERFLKIIL